MKEGFSVGARFPHTPAGHPLRLSQLAHLRAVSLVHFKPLGFGFQLVAAGQKEPVAVPLFGGGEVVDHQLLGVDRHPFLEDGHAFRSGVFVQIAAQLFAHKITYGEADDLFGLIGLGVDDFDGPVPQLFPVSNPSFHARVYSARVRWLGWTNTESVSPPLMQGTSPRAYLFFWGARPAR